MAKFAKKLLHAGIKDIIPGYNTFKLLKKEMSKKDTKRRVK